MAHQVNRLPIKVISTRSHDVKVNPTGGGGPRTFGEVTEETRQSLIGKFDRFSEEISRHNVMYPGLPIVGSVMLKKEAVAKSHRPTALFNENSCPIIGGGLFGELLVEITPRGFSVLKRTIGNNVTKKVVANISTVDDVEISTCERFMDTISISKVVSTGEPLKVELFSYSNARYNVLVDEQFRNLISTTEGIDLMGVQSYSESLKVYKIKATNSVSLQKIVDFRGVKKLSCFPEFQIGASQLQTISSKLTSEMINPISGVEYPIVGLIDSGIAVNHPILEKWIHARELYVVTDEQNNRHGSFVGGVMVFGERLLNPLSDTTYGAKIVDVVAIPNDDPSYGKVGYIGEFELIEMLKEVVPKYKNEVTIWNLSLGTDSICRTDSFSDLAIAIDDLQKNYEVVFVLSAGNYEDSIRHWPVQEHIGDMDRITSPADSVRSIVVGSITHLESINSVVKSEMPSPFSRRGPGPNCLIKPDVVHYGGNLTANSECTELGVVSFNEYGDLCEDVGTSFSAPHVSGLLARVQSSLSDRPSINLLKALLIHSTRQQSVPYIPTVDEINYYGFGRPASLETIISCTESTATIIYEGELVPGRYIEIPDFPYPLSLARQGKWHGEIWMTLVCDPPLNPNYGLEYCRTNVDVHLGTYHFYEEDGIQKMKYKGQVPQEYKLGARYERDLVEHGFKWSPVKLYHRKLTNGINLEPWRISLDLLGRSDELIDTPQKFALVITIRDPEGGDIYSEIVGLLNQGFVHSDLEIKEQIRASLNI